MFKSTIVMMKDCKGILPFKLEIIAELAVIYDRDLCTQIEGQWRTEILSPFLLGSPAFVLALR